MQRYTLHCGIEHAPVSRRASMLYLKIVCREPSLPNRTIPTPLYVPLTNSVELLEIRPADTNILISS